MIPVIRETIEKIDLVLLRGESEVLLARADMIQLRDALRIAVFFDKRIVFLEKQLKKLEEKEEEDERS